MRIAAGLTAARSEDIDFYDRNSDRKVTLIDAVTVLRDPCPTPTRWWQLAFNNAMCSNPPALSDIDRDALGLQEVVITSDYQNPPHSGPACTNPDPSRAGNPQQVWVIRDSDGSGSYGILAGWPRPLRDAPNGITLANFTGNRGSLIPWTVLSTNYQDSYDVGIPPAHDCELFSHLWAWTANGGPVDVNGDTVQDFPNERAPDLATGLGVGHANSAPAAFDFNNDGIPEVLFHFQGQLKLNQGGFFGGGLKAYVPYIVNAGAAEPTLLFQTSTDPSNLWYLRAADALFDNPPIFPNLDPTNDAPAVTRNIVIASETGYLYGWDSAGDAASGWEANKPRADQYTYDGVAHPNYTDYFEYDESVDPNNPHIVREPAPLQSPITAGNADGQSGDEVFAASGETSHYYGFFKDTTRTKRWPLYTLDGAVYCWNKDASLRWRYPAYVPAQRLQQFLPAFASGVSLGHLNGPNGPVAAVVGNVNGEVYAFNASTGALLWKFKTHAPVHIAYRQIRAEPLIFDVNADGSQDVVIGTSDGYVYALKGNTTNPNGEELWRVRTFAGVPDSFYLDAQGRRVRESHYEEVRGMAVGNLYGNDRSRATIVVCSSALQETTTSPLVGHMLILDLGPGTWNANAADWPQWQCTAQRTGTLGIPPMS